MTTKITVDAHAGWPVLIERRRVDADPKDAPDFSYTVEPNTVFDVFIWEGAEVIIRELKRKD